MTTARDAWTRPGVHAVGDGVHRIVCPLPGDGLQAVNVYALEDGDGVALLDTGTDVTALEDGLRALGTSLEDVTTIVCTHSHYDHYGLAGTIRSRSGAPVLLGAGELGNLRSTLDRETFARAQQENRRAMVEHGAQALLEEGRAPTFEQVQTRGPWEPPDRLLADGERVELRERVLEAVLTPGHTRGHLMFRDAQAGLVFGGDHLLPHITPSLGFEYFNDGKALERFLASLAAIRGVQARWVAPGHGPVFSDLAGRVEELEAHHASRLDACLEALDGPATAFAVAQRLTWTRHERPFAALDVFNRMLATMETVTHLELLADRGRLRRERDGAVLRYA